MILTKSPKIKFYRHIIIIPTFLLTTYVFLFYKFSDNGKPCKRHPNINKSIMYDRYSNSSRKYELKDVERPFKFEKENIVRNIFKVYVLLRDQPRYRTNFLNYDGKDELTLVFRELVCHFITNEDVPVSLCDYEYRVSAIIKKTIEKPTIQQIESFVQDNLSKIDELKDVVDILKTMEGYKDN